MMSYVDPTIVDFKAYFIRDFPYGIDVEENVLDADITKGVSMAALEINQGLFISQEEYTQGFLLLAAHYLVSNLRTSSQGMSGQFSWLHSSHSVGSVSESISIPDSITSNPMYAFLTKTNYGAQYLMMVYPRLIGNVFTVEGGTQA